MMLEQQMFARKSQYEPVEEGSGAYFIEELKPYLDEIRLSALLIKSLDQKATT